MQIIYLYKICGWFSSNSKTNFPTTIAYGIPYFAKNDNSLITEVDKNIMRKIITSVTY